MKRLALKERTRILNGIGVPGSVNHRILILMESVGFTLAGADDLNHPSRTTLHFVESQAKYRTTITLEDFRLDPEEEASA